MAITALITLSTPTCVAEQAVAVACTVSNSGGSAVNVLSIIPTAPINGTTQESTSIAKGAPNLGPGMTVSVAASGSTAFNFNVVPHEPTGDPTSNPAEASQLIYSIGATVYTSDGAITVATPTTLTVTNPAGL